MIKYKINNMFNHLKTKPYLIAEIGINHNGSIQNAKKLIDLAKKYNFDAVKFQKRNPEISTPDDQKKLMRETPWGALTYLDYKKKIEFSLKDYLAINSYCKKKKSTGLHPPGMLKVRFSCNNLIANIIKLLLLC